MLLFVDRIHQGTISHDIACDRNILENKKPFQNFKNKIDQSHFRQDWFDFKQKEIEKKVATELKISKARAQK